MIHYLLVAVVLTACDDAADEVEVEVVEECPTFEARANRCPNGDPDCCEAAGFDDCGWGMFPVAVSHDPDSDCQRAYCAAYSDNGAGCCSSSSYNDYFYNCDCVGFHYEGE